MPSVHIEGHEERRVAVVEVEPTAKVLVSSPVQLQKFRDSAFLVVDVHESLHSASGR